MSRTAIHASLGVATESTVGTFVAPTRHIPIISESLSREIERIDSDAIRAGRYTRHSDDWSVGKSMVSGTIETELYDRSIGTFLRHVGFSGGSTSGSGPYTTAMTPGSSAGLSMSVQVGRPDVSGTTRVFSYQGMKTAGVTVSCAAGERAMLSVDMIGLTETTSESLTSVSYAASLVPFTWDQATISLQGASNTTVSEIEIAITQPLDEDRLYLGSSTLKDPLPIGLLDIGISGTAEFESLTFYNNYTAGTVASYSIAFSDGTYSLTFAGSARMDAGTPTVGDRGIIRVPFELTPVASSDASAMTITVVSADTTP